jgi:hypothetical protein
MHLAEGVEVMEGKACWALLDLFMESVRKAGRSLTLVKVGASVSSSWKAGCQGVWVEPAKKWQTAQEKEGPYDKYEVKWLVQI